ncbi:nitrosoguanidine resistance protein SNG1-like, partial [Teratosphaeria destructans]
RVRARHEVTIVLRERIPCRGVHSSVSFCLHWPHPPTSKMVSKDAKHESGGDDQSSDNAGQEQKGQQNGGEENKDEEQQSGPPQAVGYWDPRLKHVRHEAWTKWTITTAVLMAFILGVLSIYWAALFRVEQNLGSLVVYVVDMDGAPPFNTDGHPAIVGPIVSNLGRSMVASSTPTLGFEFMNGSAFGNDPVQVRQAIFDFDAWAAITINPNATAMLYDAVQNGNTGYDPMGACQLTFISSRDDTNWYDFMSPILNEYMTQATTMVGERWTRMVMQNATTNTTLVSNAAAVPQALSPAIGFSQFDLRPFYPYQIIPSVSIGLIYLIILSFFSFSFYLPIHFKFHQLIIWRWCATIAAYFMLSLAYSWVSLAFQVNFSGGNPVTSETESTVTIDGYSNPDAYGRGTFPVYWMLNFFGMIAVGLACENVAMLVGQPWTGLWLIFWVITNVSTSFYDIDVEAGFFAWGYAWPLHYVVEGSRQLLFGLHSRIGLDFGVLIAWGAVNTALFPLACYFMRWKSQHHVHEYYK